MRPATELTFTTCPDPRSRMAGTTAWVQRITPQKLVSNTTLAASMSTSSTVAFQPMPALFTSTSSWPASATTCPVASRTLASSVTSRRTGRTSQPASFASESSFSAFAVSRIAA